MELWLLSISMWPIPYRSVFGSWNTVVASYALINKVLLKFHADLLRFLFLFHGLFIFYFIFMVFCHSLLFECCMEVNSPGQQDHPGWGWCALKNAWKTSSKNIYIYESCEFCFSVNSSLSINPLNLFSAEASQSLFSWLPQGEERLSIKNAYVLSYCLAHLT